MSLYGAELNGAPVSGMSTGTKEIRIFAEERYMCLYIWLVCMVGYMWVYLSIYVGISGYWHSGDPHIC